MSGGLGNLIPGMSFLENLLALLNKLADFFKKTPRDILNDRKDTIGGVHDAVTQAKDSRGDMSSLDDLTK